MKVFHLVTGLKRRRGGNPENLARVRDILKRLDSYDDILSDENDGLTQNEKFAVWRAIQYIKTGKIRDLDKGDGNV